MDSDSQAGGRALVLQWAEEGIIPSSRVDEALAVTGVTPTAGEWRRFVVDRILLWSGASFLAISVIFFLAFNWHDLGRYAQFGLVETLIIAAVLAYWRFWCGSGWR